MQDSLTYLKSIPPEIFLSLKILFIGAFLFFIVIIFISLKKSSWMKIRFLQDMTEFLTYRSYGAKKIVRIWLKAKKRLDTGSESEYKLAVIEADSLLNDILEKMGFKGDNLEDRLKQATKVVLPGVEEACEAHKIRNNVVYDPDYKLTLEQAQKALGIYEKALQDLQVF